MATSHPAFGVLMSRDFVSAFALTLLIMFVMSFTNFAHAQTAPGTLIQNTAVLEFSRPGSGNDMAFSNAVASTVEPLPSPSTLTILRATDPASATVQSSAGPTSCRVGNAYVPLAAPVLSNGSSVNPLQQIAMAQATTVHGGEAVFVQVTDRDQNRDAAGIDTVDMRVTSVAGDAETIRLSESGLNTGVFVGYVQTRAAAVVVGDCVLQVVRDSQIASRYVDPINAADIANASALVDPFGLVFDSTSGLAVNGAVVSLLNATTGMPATVFGDDGVSAYPATVATGSQVTDAGGTVYVLAPGVFRFPMVAPGQYRLAVIPPPTHAFPSTRTIADLNALPGGPFQLQAGSFGQDFTVAGPVAVAVDVPVDAANSQLFLQKTTTTTVAALGDFVQYT
ncbi:MAG: hypothetical protein H7Y02_08905, partial [Candidatus Obscuribacterales bacterium]|nr:hypothetical protein [Steroidobacteraceae bacterium]